MKTIILSFGLFLSASVTHAQVRVDGAQGVRATGRDGEGIINKYADIKGSPFLSETWGMGTVVFSNGLKSELLLLNMDLYGNQPQFKQDNEFRTFADPIFEFSFPGELNGRSHNFKFRNGYPETNGQAGKYFFQVVEDGNFFQLLKKAEKVVGEEMVSIGVMEKTFKYQEAYFLFNASSKSMIKVPKNRKELASAASGFSDKLAAYLGAAKSFNPRQEADLIEMVRVLNK